MKRVPYFTLLLLGFALLFSSCISNLYTPNEAYMLGVSEQGDVKLAGSALSNGNGFNDLHRQSNIQLALSPIKQLGLVGSHFRQSLREKNTPFNSYRRHTEFGIGYYNKSGKDKETDQSFVLQDVYSGLGWGQHYELYPTAGETYSTYRRFFLHYGLHLWWKQNVSIGFGIRYARTRFNTIQLIGKLPPLSNIGIGTVYDRNPINVLEGSLQMQGGNKYFKVFISSTGVLRSKYLDFSDNYRMGAPIATIGLVFDLDEVWKKAIPGKKKD